MTAQSRGRRRGGVGARGDTYVCQAGLPGVRLVARRQVLRKGGGVGGLEARGMCFVFPFVTIVAVYLVSSSSSTVESCFIATCDHARSLCVAEPLSFLYPNYSFLN